VGVTPAGFHRGAIFAGVFRIAPKDLKLIEADQLQNASIIEEIRAGAGNLSGRVD
jgi:hypothetical protein